MSKFATKAAANMFCQARYEAAKSNERLSSREGAAEEIGIDRTRLARIELGSTIPYQEEVLLMADCYKAPELKGNYCREMCPLGKNMPKIENAGLDRISLRMLSSLKKINEANAAHDQSHNGMITRFKAKGTQYCGTTAQDKNHMDNLFEVAFATRNSQSIMSGCTGYYNRFYATVVENNVERIIISKSDANYLVVGSTVSIGNATALSGSNPTDDRANAGLHAKANRVIITKIEDYDSNNSAVYVDNGGTKFSTGSTMVGSTEVKTTIVTMPWHTGACDNVLGSCGSPNSNTSGKDPYILFGVEMFLGFYEVISNVILKISNHVMTACICYDCTKLATSVTSDYVECGYSIADTQASWKYISELGYDPENPSVRHGTKVAASSSTGYADGQYTDKLDQTSDGLREWLSGGYLGVGSDAGRWCAGLFNGLGVGWWPSAARLSASGRCAKAAA